MTFIVQRNGVSITLSEIKSEVEGEAILDELDRDIVSIEQQIADGVRNGCDGNWLIKARTALRHRKLARPKLQARIAEIRRQAKAAAKAEAHAQNVSIIGMQRRAFILAAKETLGTEAFDRLWDRAREILPDAFVGDEA